MKLFGFGQHNLKKNADELIIKGNWSKALEAYKTIVEAEPDNIRHRQKLGDIYSKLNRKDEAIQEYTLVAEGYANEGFLIKAIAINKLIMKLDPNNSETQEKLAGLYSSRGIEYRQQPSKADMEEEENRAEKVPKIPLFSDLSHEEFCNVISKLKDNHYNPEDVICREGDKGDSIFIISEGDVNITRKDYSGKEIPLATLSDGDFFGEFAFFSKSERHATVVAINDTHIFEMTKDDLEEITKEFPRVNEVLFNFYKERVISNLLAMSPVFSHCTPEERTTIMESFEVKTFKIDEVIINEGDAGDSLFLIKSGKVKVSTVKNGQMIELAELVAGEFFGEIALLTGQPRTATVSAITEVELLELKKTVFDDIASKHPKITKVLQDYLKDRATKTVTAIINYEKESRAKNKLV